MTTEAPMLEVLVEERSAARALARLLPKIVPGAPYEIREFAGKDMLMKRLPDRLRGYASRMTWEPLRIVVLVDRDDDDCKVLKKRLDDLAVDAGLTTSASRGHFQVLNRIAVEESESWFFGDVPAIRSVCPRVSASLAGHPSGLLKLEAAAAESNRSSSFRVFRDGVRRLLKEDHAQA